MPFERAVTEMGYFWRVSVTEPTVRRTTEGAGAAYVAVQTAEVEQLERTLPPAPEGPAVQLMSVDGAYVPLVHKGWAEVKTLALGTVGEPVLEKGEPRQKSLGDWPWWKPIGGARRRRNRCAPSRMGPSGNKGSLTCIVKTPFVFWISPMLRTRSV